MLLKTNILYHQFKIFHLDALKNSCDQVVTEAAVVCRPAIQKTVNAF